ncbi:Chromosomal replication initiator protein DnaA [subsurface metagenome]|jgi:chromosomal replication initiation ATPase DnaA
MNTTEARSAQEIWESALTELKSQLSKASYRIWLKKTVGLCHQGNQFVVSVPNEFVAQYLDKTQRSLIQKTLITITHRDIEVGFTVL